MTIVTSRDVQEIVSKLSCDKAKTREEGLKLLNNWLEGETSTTFCKFLARNSAVLKSDQIPHSETWPFLIKLLVHCALSETSASKRRSPKQIFAKTLRLAVQRAEDSTCSGNVLVLLSVAKKLFSHIWDVLRDVPSFQSEYGIILRHLLAVRDYRFHMRKQVYCSLVLFYMGKVEATLSGKNNSEYNLKEDAFRCVLTLHSLLKNPPGDFPDNLREDVVKGFVGVFILVRDEGKISRKLVDCINTYLVKDGPNLGCRSLEIHNALQQFLFRSWLTTHDRGLKDAFTLYARLQLNLIRRAADVSNLLEQLMDVVCKELDQSNIPSTGISWTDVTKDDKFKTLSSSQCGLVELTALVFYRASDNSSKAPSAEKRLRREDPASLLKEGLIKGKLLWNAAFCCLTRKYFARIRRDLFIYWFEGIYTNFERNLNDANMEHMHDGLFWTLRSLQELSSVRLLPVSRLEILEPCFTQNEVDSGWQVIWNCLMRWLPIFSNIAPVADAALVLLGNILVNDLVNISIVPQDVWDLRLFKRTPSMSLLYFISCYFSRKGSQGDLRDALHLRQNLLRAVLGLLDNRESCFLNERVVTLLPAATYALCAGSAPFPLSFHELYLSDSFLDASEASDDCVVTEEQEYKEHDYVECSVEVLAEIYQGSRAEVSVALCHEGIRLPRQLRDPLLHEMETYLLVAVVDKEFEKMLLSDVFFLCALLSNFMYGSFLTRQREAMGLFLRKIGQCLLKLLDHSISTIEEKQYDIQSQGCLSSDLMIFDAMSCTVASLRSFISCPSFCDSKWRNQLDSSPVIQSIERLLKALTKLYEEYCNCMVNFQSDKSITDLSDSDIGIKDFHSVDNNKSRIMDMELDVTDRKSVV